MEAKSHLRAGHRPMLSLTAGWKPLRLCKIMSKQLEGMQRPA